MCAQGIVNLFVATGSGEIWNVADAENNVALVLYSSDGQFFTPYTQPIAVNITPTTQSAVIATDAAGAQASRVPVALSYQLYAPYTSRYNDTCRATNTALC